jgi:hypothetical protein
MAGAAERIQEMLRNFEEQAAKAGQLQSAVQDMRGTATSDDRSITVSVAPSGAVLDLQLAPNRFASKPTSCSSRSWTRSAGRRPTPRTR